MEVVVLIHGKCGRAKPGLPAEVLILCITCGGAKSCLPAEVVVDPADEDLLGRQAHELLERLSLLQQHGQVWVLVQVHVRQQADLRDKNID